MQTWSATDLNNRSGEMLEEAQAEPILIVKGKNKRKVAVILSYTHFNRLLEGDNRWLDARERTR